MKSSDKRDPCTRFSDCKIRFHLPRIFQTIALLQSPLTNAVVDWGVVLLGIVVAQGAAALSLIVLARRVVPLEYGQYVSTYSLISFLAIFPNFGMDVWLMTQGSLNNERAVCLWRSTMRARGVLLLIWVPSMLGVSLLLPRDTFPSVVFVLTVVGLACDSMVQLSFSAFRSMEQHRKVTLFQVVSSLLLFTSIVLLPIKSGIVAGFALLRSGITLLTLLVILGYARNVWRLIRESVQVPEVLRGAKPFMVTEFSSVIYERADLVIISLVLGSVASGIYGPAISILQVAFLSSRAIFYVAVPVLSRSFQIGQGFTRQGVLQLLAQVCVGAAFSIVIFVLAPQMVEVIFGSAYSISASVLRLLSPIPVLRAISFAFGAMLASGERQSERMKVQLVVASLSVLAILLVIGPWGIGGVALVYVLGEICLCFGYTVLSYHWFFRRSRAGGVLKCG